jgi:DNA-binding LacI/PurR family transcriptional regulator
MGALRALREAGLRVPQDVSVIGIDDHDVSGVLGLSTVAQPAAEQGRLAARILLDPLGGRALPPAVCGPVDVGGTDPAATPVVLPTRLVVRDSTAPPRAD